MATQTGNIDAVTKAFFLSESEQMKYYNEWARKYEEDSAKERYHGPENTLEYCLRWLKPTDRIIDICAGTGHMGYLLKQHGYTNMDAHDGAEKMLEIAKLKHSYKNFICAIFEPGKDSSIPSDSYYGLVTVGSFVPGHLSSDHVPELLRIVKKGGKIVIGMRKQWLTYPGDEYKWNYDLQKDFDRFEKEGKWKLLQKAFKPDHCHGVEGAYLVYEKL